MIFIERQSQLNLSVDEIPQKLSINDLVLTKGSLKAINLLNEEILNKIFFEEKMPNFEILLVYKIFFQLIKNQDIINYKDYNDKFWEKCRNYFRAFNGKTGDCLNEVIKQNKIIIDGENIYKVYKIVHKEIYKIIPAYFSKICGTTGLFVFFIKDILDFLGFSNDKKFKNNSYWSFSEIINCIDSKINVINQYLNIK